MLQGRPPTSESRQAIWQEHKTSIDYEVDNEPAAMEGDQSFYEDKVSMHENLKNESESTEEGCWLIFKRTIRSCWATRHTEDTVEDRELYIKTTIRELVIYVFFLTVLMIIAFGMVTDVMFDYTNTLKTLFLNEKFVDKETTFLTAKSIPDFWNFLFGPLIHGLYWDKWYNGRDMLKSSDLIYYENKMLGVPRIRQLKIRNDSCGIYKDFQAAISGCYGPFSVRFEDTNSFGNDTLYPGAWTYTPREKMNSSGFFTIFGEYHDGGFYQDLFRNKSLTIDVFRYLFKNLWIDRGTRVVFVDFTLYNPNINLFSVMRLIIEFPPTGGIEPSYDFRIVKLLRYVTGLDYCVLACELIFLFFILYYIIEETIEIKKHGLQYFTEFWNILDVIVIIISVICSIFNIYRTANVGNILDKLLSNMDQFPSFDFLSFWQQYFNYAIAINLFIAWIKIFKYISFNKTMTQLSTTLSRCSMDLAGFAVMFFIIFFAFAQLATLIFGSQIRDFRSFYNAAITQFRIILGDFDYQQLESAHRLLGPLYFILFVFFVFFVLINMFLAIITDTYSDIKDELATQENEFEMADFFKEKAKRLIERMNKKQQKIKDIQQAIMFGDLNHDNQLDFDEWRHQLKSCGYADGEIEAVFSKYDIDGDRILNTKEQNLMQNELNDEKNDLDKTITDNSSTKNDLNMTPSPEFEAYIALKRRVDKMEQNVTSIVTKLDNLLTNFSKIDIMKTEQSTVIMNLLDTLTAKGNLSLDERRLQLSTIIHTELDKYVVKDTVVSNSMDLRERPGTGISNRSFLWNG